MHDPPGELCAAQQWTDRMSHASLAPALPRSISESRTGPGAFVIIVGPDGVGKTTVAARLMGDYPGPASYFHFVPPVFGPLDERPGAAAPHRGKGAPGGSRVLGWVRALRNFARYWIAYVVRVRPAVRRGALVIGDRGAYGYLVQPQALKFYGPATFATALLRALPAPDLVVNLSAPADVIHQRKQELSPGEIRRELDAWAALPTPRLRTFDATEPPSAIVRRILEAL
jgi:thymidylate kinase